MKPVVIIVMAIVFGLVVGLSINVSAQDNLIPLWIKDTAGFWVDGHIDDTEFISALQYLVKEGILVISDETSSEIVASQSIQEPKISQSKVTESSSKFTYEIGDKVENKQSVDFTYEFYNGETWIRDGKGTVICYMSDGDFRQSELGFDLSVIPYGKIKSSKTVTYTVNNAEINRCEIINEEIKPANRILINSLDFQMVKCEPQIHGSNYVDHVGAKIRGFVTNNNSQDIDFAVNFRAYDNEGYVIASRIPYNTSDYFIKAGQTIPLEGSAEIEYTQRGELEVASCKVVMFKRF